MHKLTHSLSDSTFSICPSLPLCFISYTSRYLSSHSFLDAYVSSCFFSSLILPPLTLSYVPLFTSLCFFPPPQLFPPLSLHPPLFVFSPFPDRRFFLHLQFFFLTFIRYLFFNYFFSFVTFLTSLILSFIHSHPPSLSPLLCLCFLHVSLTALLPVHYTSLLFHYTHSVIATCDSLTATRHSSNYFTRTIFSFCSFLSLFTLSFFFLSLFHVLSVIVLLTLFLSLFKGHLSGYSIFFVSFLYPSLYWFIYSFPLLIISSLLVFFLLSFFVYISFFLSISLSHSPFFILWFFFSLLCVLRIPLSHYFLIAGYYLPRYCILLSRLFSPTHSHASPFI